MTACYTHEVPSSAANKPKSTHWQYVLLAVLAAGCFILGVLLIPALSPDRRVGPVVLPDGPPPTATPSVRQVSVLILVVDDLKLRSPSLTMCWVLTARPDVRDHYYLTAFPGETLIDTRTLDDYFRKGRDLEAGSQLVIDALHIRTGGGLSAGSKIILDGAIVGQLVNQVGGLSIDGTTYDGELIRETMSRDRDWPVGERLAFHSRAAAAYLEAVRQLAWTPEKLRQLYTLYAAYSPDVGGLLDLADHGFPSPTMEITIEVFDPDRADQ